MVHTNNRIHTGFKRVSSVTRSCPTLWDPMNRSTPGLPVHHQLPEFNQTHVHRVGDAIQPSHPLSSPSPPAPNPSQHQGLFQWVSSLHEVAKYSHIERCEDCISQPPLQFSWGHMTNWANEMWTVNNGWILLLGLVPKSSVVLSPPLSSFQSPAWWYTFCQQDCGGVGTLPGW